MRSRLRAKEESEEKEEKEDLRKYLTCSMCPHLKRDEDGNYFCPIRLNDVNPDMKICDEYIISVITGKDISEVG